MSRVVLAGADEDLMLRVKQATDGDVFVLPPGRLPADPARLFEQLVDAELDELPEQAFFNVGGMDSVREKAKSMSKEDKEEGDKDEAA